MHRPCSNPLKEHDSMHFSFSASLSFPQSPIQVNGGEIPSLASVSASIEINKNLVSPKFEREKEREKGNN